MDLGIFLSKATIEQKSLLLDLCFSVAGERRLFGDQKEGHSNHSFSKYNPQQIKSQIKEYLEQALKLGMGELQIVQGYYEKYMGRQILQSQPAS